MYLEYDKDQLTEGKCLRCANFLSKPQNTCTIERVAAVTGSEKSPPGGDTLEKTKSEKEKRTIHHLIKNKTQNQSIIFSSLFPFFSLFYILFAFLLFTR